MEIIAGVEVCVLVLGILSSCSAKTFATASHVVYYRVNVNLDALIATALNHCFKLTLGPQLRFELVAHSLIANPPLLALDVLLGRGDQNPVNAYIGEILTLLSNGIKVPQKHLHANLILKPVRFGI